MSKFTRKQTDAIAVAVHNQYKSDIVFGVDKAQPRVYRASGGEE